MTALFGGATLNAMPLAVRAQQKTVRMMGYLHFATPSRCGEQV